MSRCLAPAFTTMVCAGCECGSEVTLVIDARSNLVAGVEVDRAVTEVYADSERVSLHYSSREVVFGDPLEDALRLAELRALAPGSYRVVVHFEREGAPIVSQTVLNSVTTTSVSTVMITRDCGSVVCDQRTSCAAGVCVPDECEDARECPPAMCEGDGECSASGACAVARCLERTCQVFPDHTSCAAGEYCQPEEGCLVLIDEPDAGTGCPAAGCDDANPCTDDACVEGACVYTPNAAACDDGVFCNGADQCGAGSCSLHPGDPRPGASVCEEASDGCVGCATDADCPPPTPGPWSACVFASDCAYDGTRTRTVTTYTCNAGACQPSAHGESGPCARPSRENTVCGATTCGGYGGCAYSDACDRDGEQTRNCTERRCRSQVCADVGTTEERDCDRDTDGAGCGSSCGGWSACDYGSECDQEGTRSRQCDDRTCGGGSCRTTARTERDDCARSTEDDRCGENPAYCGRQTVCHVCRSGACALNQPHYDASCRPSCGEAANLSGTVGACCASSSLCPAIGPTADCDVCCEATFCY